MPYQSPTLIEPAYTKDPADIRDEAQAVEHWYALQQGLVVRVGCPALDGEGVGWALAGNVVGQRGHAWDGTEGR